MSSNRKGTTKSGGQKHYLDKFYTKPEIAQWCINKIDTKEYSLIIEPSAGNGAFSNQIENILAFDLHPENPTIKKQNWFDFNTERAQNKILVIGNPPFGQQNNLAIKFINHAAKFADTIAFILPKSFMKESIQDKINLNFHLTQEYQIPKNSFLLNGEPIDVPCVFQIWEYDSVNKRIIVPAPVPKAFKFVKKKDNPDLYFQRIGGKTGQVGADWVNRSEQSNYFIKIEPGFSKKEIIEATQNLQFPSRYNTVGPRSLSKKEFLVQLKKEYPKFF